MIKVLIIEDEDKIRSSLKRILELSGFDVLVASNGIEGIGIAKQTLPDIIFCDVMMPIIDGHQVLQKLKDHNLTTSIPFIFLTAKSDLPDIREGMNLGADDYLTKPVKSKDLLTCIQTRLDKKELQLQQSQIQLTNLGTNIARSIPHELNTPLTGIIGFAEILSTMPDPLVQELSNEILASSERLHATITKFLVYTELVELTIHSSQKNCSLNQVSPISTSSPIESIAQKIAIKSQRQSDLCFKLQDGNVTMSPLFYERLLGELIDNAFKFSEQGDSIIIGNHWEKDHMILTVQDHGRGMKPEQITAVAAYNQFERTVYEQQGIGLGLVIVKYIAELQGGNLTISSQPGIGTTMRVQLPIQPTLATND